MSVEAVEVGAYARVHGTDVGQEGEIHARIALLGSVGRSPSATEAELFVGSARSLGFYKPANPRQGVYHGGQGDFHSARQVVWSESLVMAH